MEGRMDGQVQGMQELTSLGSNLQNKWMTCGCCIGANTSIKKHAGTHVCLDSVQEASTAISFHVHPLQGLAPQANINTTT